MPHLSLHSPIGDLTLHEAAGAIVAVTWRWRDGQSETPLLRRAAAMVRAYFDGEVTDFDLPLAPEGTAFQRTVWAAMRAIPYGRTASYAALARDVGSAPRAVGGACASNRIPIIIPCHRVVSAGGGLGGFSGGTGRDTKAALLRLEGWPGETAAV